MINNENLSTNQMNSKSGAAIKSKSLKGKSIEETYTKKTQLEHILLRPDTYIGSVERQTQPMWVYDCESKQIVNRQCTFVPGLYKIFDEIIVNAADNKQRDPSMNRIEVTIDAEHNSIRVWNNGNGVPVHVHAEHGIYVPELIFGHLLTGSNFDDEEAKTTGGRNGYGAKLANIFSTRFIVETSDKSRGLKFRQEFSNNMSVRSDPVVLKASTDDFTCITFYPDIQRFKMDRLDEDIIALLSKRVYDVAGTNTASGAKLSVYLNGSRIDAKNFESYISMYQGIEPPVAFERLSDRWEVGVGISDGSFQQVSFVNSICTMKGGCHVNYIVDQLTSRLAAVVKKKNKGEEVKAHQIKNHLSVFVNALIVNPAFDSQTKETLTTKASAFGSVCAVSDKMMKLVEKSGVIDNILNWAKFKQTAELKKKSGSKRSKLIGITKLDDANCAGTAKSNQCTLILTEGDSAKALAISGLGVVGRDYYGVFPLKGKLLNVREASHQQIIKNEEIQNIITILGLTYGKTYSDTSSLRYGHLMIMTDQDHDGSHIKGLLINFLHHFWPSLLQITGFLQQFITPIVKCIKGKKEQTFFTIPEYLQWREEHEEGKGWRIKYYKGLGTSTAAEAKEYFSNLRVHEIDFEWDERADDMIDMAFAKKRVEDRKLWLLAMEPGVHIDYTADKISYNNFVNHELILFSHADNERSISHFMDGLKPSQRKVLFSCFKRNLKQEIKVAQLAGYISEHSAYHHGEASLTQTIIGMAQSYVGSNNINLLSPCGQFGTRLMGGKDAASPRYVFTKLEAITRSIFHPHDDPILEYLEDDGQSIEPVHYVPIIPMALVNGSEGIGTGWSSSIPTYNPRDVIGNLRLMIAGDEPCDMKPWFRGFTGEVVSKTGKDCNNFVVCGRIEQTSDDTVVISELPVGKWTTDYKQFLESVTLGGPAPAAGGEGGPAATPFVKDFKEHHTDTTVLFTVTVPAEKLVEIQAERGGLMKKFKLEGSVATSNMHMFDLHSQIRKFEGPMHVMAEFFGVRMQFYDRRKKHLTEKLSEEWEKLDNKMRFILAVIGEQLVVSNRKKKDIMRDLQTQGFTAFHEKKPSDSSGSRDDGGSVDEQGQGQGQSQVDNESSSEKGYDYLLSMKIWSLTMEKVEELIALRNAKRGELDVLISKSAEDLWLEDLNALELALDDFDSALEEATKQEDAARKKANHSRNNKDKGKAQKPRAKVMKGKAKAGSDDDSEGDSGGDDVSSDSDFEEGARRKKDKGTARSKAASSAKTVASTSSKPQTSITKYLTTSTSSTTSKAAAAPGKAASSSTVQKSIIKYTTSNSKVAAAVQVVPPIVVPARNQEMLRETMTLADRLKLKSSSAPAVVDLSGSDDLFDSLSAFSSVPAAAPRERDDDGDGYGGRVLQPLQTTKSGARSKPKAAAAAPAVKTTPQKGAAGVKRSAKSSAVDGAAAAVREVFSPSDVSPVAAKRTKTTKPKAAAAPLSKAAAAVASKAPVQKSTGTTKTLQKNSKASKKAAAVDDDDSDDEMDFSPVKVVARSPKPVRARKQITYDVDESEEEEASDFDSDDDDEADASDFSD